MCFTPSGSCVWKQWNAHHSKCFSGWRRWRVRGRGLQCACVRRRMYMEGFWWVSGERHFSCSRAGMLMFQPMACRSKPQVNRLHVWFSSFHAVQHTIRLWPCTNRHKHTRAFFRVGFFPVRHAPRCPLCSVLTILLLRGSLASLTPLMSNSRTCRLSCGRAMILWLAETLILKDQKESQSEAGTDARWGSTRRFCSYPLHLQKCFYETWRVQPCVHLPVHSRVGADGCYRWPHVPQIPHFDCAVVTSRDHIVAHREDGGSHRATKQTSNKMLLLCSARHPIMEFSTTRCRCRERGSPKAARVKDFYVSDISFRSSRGKLRKGRKFLRVTTYL